MNRFDGLMFYALTLSTVNYAMDDLSRMKEVKTQQTTTRNLTQLIFIQSHHLIHIIIQWSKFTILHQYLFHYAPLDLMPYTPSHLRNTPCISPDMENHSFQALWMKCVNHSLFYSSLSLSSPSLCYSSFPILYRLVNALYAWFPLFNLNRSPIVWMMLYSSENGDCIDSWELQWIKLWFLAEWALREMKWPYWNHGA